MDLSVEKLYFTTKFTKGTELYLVEFFSQEHNKHNHLRQTSFSKNHSFFFVFFVRFVVHELFRLYSVYHINTAARSSILPTCSANV